MNRAFPDHKLRAQSPAAFLEPKLRAAEGVWQYDIGTVDYALAQETALL